jgi:hypothetical protein
MEDLGTAVRVVIYGGAVNDHDSRETVIKNKFVSLGISGKIIIINARHFVLRGTNWRVPLNFSVFGAKSEGKRIEDNHALRLQPPIWCRGVCECQTNNSVNAIVTL